LAFPIDLEFPVTYVIASEGYIRGLHYLELWGCVDNVYVDAGISWDEDRFGLDIEI
jgi:hypothetical protein